MLDILGTTAVLAAGFAAGVLAGYRLNLPAGTLIGSIVGVGGGLTILGFPSISPPPEINQLLQIMVGLLVGFGISRSSLNSGVRAILPAFLLTAVMISTGILSALACVRFTSMEFSTALFAAAPGGITEMSTIGESLGADGAAVAAVHLVRILLAILIANVISRKLAGPVPARSSFVHSVRDEDSPKPSDSVNSLRTIALPAAVGVAGGGLGIVAQVPTGAVIGAFAGSALIGLWKDRAASTGGMRFTTQAMSGAIIGLGISDDFFGELVDLAGAGGLIIFTQMLVWLAMYWLLVKLLGYDGVTSIFASAPGGMKEIVPGSAQAGANTIVVTFAHLVRKISTITLLPSLVTWLLIQ